MSNALVTIIAPLALDRVADAETRINALGNPARPDIAAALDRLVSDDGTHFMSLHAVRSKDGVLAYLAMEISADGGEDEGLARIVQAIGDDLRPVFSLAQGWREPGDLLEFLRSHRAKIGCGWFDNPGVVFAGTPDMTVGRIRAESRLAAQVTALLGAQPGHWTGLQRIAAVREALAKDPEFAPALEPATAQPPFEPPSTPLLVAQLAVSFARVFLWPVGILLLAWMIFAGVREGSLSHGVGPRLGAFLLGAVSGLWSGFWVALIAILAILGVGFALLRRAEGIDPLEERTSDRETLAAMFQRENRLAQNHMLSVTQRKPGAIRWFTSRLVFWVVGELATRLYRPGFLSDIGTIHFARWVTAPGTRDVLFFSNYDSSWESYLEDFITRAHAGLTSVWSNSVGFPRSENLFQKGATDGERFKRYARHSMIPTRFWYSAYPTLTTGAVRTNAEIRRGLSGVMTEDEAVRWLALFGSAERPPSKLVSSEIQSLVFGGLGFMKYGTCLLYELPQDHAAARRWLSSIAPHVAFNDGRRLGREAVVTLALGAGGLSRLGLPEEGLATFPFAFLEGMTTEARQRILGDSGESAPARWRWGRSQPDAALLVYGYTPSAVEALEDRLAALANATGVALTHRVPLKEIAADKKEPFGFLDGVSQPIIRGTYKGLRGVDPIHLVEPGEFILGYPDNRNNLPPGPTLPATADPDNRLPLVDAGDDFGRAVVDNPRDLGRNGSFLVIRELEQDVDGFDRYCESEAARLNERLPEPYRMDKNFIAAKLVGRWHDGSSLVRHPYLPRTHDDKTRDTVRPQPAATTTGQPVTRPARPSRAGDNDFLFGTEDPEALRCPFGAHIRRANPRDSFDPGSQDQIDISNRHRILRVGRQYRPDAGQRSGLFFMCLNGDIERQFEFMQQTWLKSPSFHGLSCEKDPLLGDGETGACGFTIPTREGPLRMSPMPPFVATRGGGYFFLPGKRLLDYLGEAT